MLIMKSKGVLKVYCRPNINNNNNNDHKSCRPNFKLLLNNIIII